MADPRSNRPSDRPSEPRLDRRWQRWLDTPGLGLIGALALAFGAIPVIWTDQLPVFSLVNFAIGTPILLWVLVRGLRRLRNASAASLYRRTLLRGGALVAGALVLAVAAERLAERSGAQFDWSAERLYELSPAILEGLEAVSAQGPIEAFLYRDAFDPRIRSTRLLLGAMSDTGHLEFDERRLDAHPDEEDCFAVGSSNTIVLTLGSGPPCQRRFERVDRPTEGTLFEALFRMRPFDRQTVVVARGAGEGDLQDPGETGYSGLGEALLTEGYRVREIVLAAGDRIPEDADVVLVLAPQRELLPGSLEALDAYLAKGGRLMAFLEPGITTGLEELLSRYGLTSPDAWVVDPASASLEGDAPGLSPLAFRYAARHPATELLSGNQMTLFRGTRAFELRKPEPEDDIDGLVYSSRRGWLADDPSLTETRDPKDPPSDVTTDYQVLVASGRYPRGENEARIVAFGDAHLASNRYLRALFNLDLVMNALHWTAARDSGVTIRPKNGGVSRGLQFPIPLENTLTLFQGLGLLVPQLLLAAGLLTWARTRT
ncbi:MAG: Gldg family protein [Myxococcota bacterium]|nr:Gldg family protein [Myxococcota bacterium]